MPDQPRRPRTLNDARTEAENVFKKVTTKPVEPPPTKAALPGVKELVSLRIDQDVLAHFQEGGPAGRTASTTHCEGRRVNNRGTPFEVAAGYFPFRSDRRPAVDAGSCGNGSVQMRHLAGGGSRQRHDDELVGQ